MDVGISSVRSPIGAAKFAVIFKWTIWVYPSLKVAYSQKDGFAIKPNHVG